MSTDKFDDEPIYEMPSPQGNGPTNNPNQRDYSVLFDQIGDVGKDILDSVSQAIDKTDFDGLANSVSNSLQRATTSLNQALTPKKTVQPRIVISKGKKTSANIAQAMVAVLAILSGLMTLSLFILTLTLPRVFVLFLILTLVFLLITGGITAGWKSLNDRYHLYLAMESFARLIGSAEQVSVAELAYSCGISTKKTRDYLQQSIEVGIIPFGRFGVTDQDRNMFYLTQAAYAASPSNSPEAHRMREVPREAAEAKAAPSPAQGSGDKRPGSLSPEVSRIIHEANDHIALIHHANDVITDAEMTRKLAHLEDVVVHIIETVRDHPESADQLGQFTSYYLPTTGKLVNAYLELEENHAQGPNADKTRHEISETLDVINTAFDKLADDLIADHTWDLTSDMNVMRTMLAQDGLTDDGGPRAGGRKVQ